MRKQTDSWKSIVRRRNRKRCAWPARPPRAARPRRPSPLRRCCACRVPYRPARRPLRLLSVRCEDDLAVGGRGGQLGRYLDPTILFPLVRRRDDLSAVEVELERVVVRILYEKGAVAELAGSISTVRRTQMSFVSHGVWMLVSSGVPNAASPRFQALSSKSAACHSPREASKV